MAEATDASAPRPDREAENRQSAEDEAKAAILTEWLWDGATATTEDGWTWLNDGDVQEWLLERVMCALRDLPSQYVIGGGAEITEVRANGWEHRCTGACAATVDGVRTNHCPHTWIEAWA